MHHPESDPLRLLDITREALELVSASAGRRAARLAGDRWLVWISAGGASCLEAYRHIGSQLRLAAGVEKILLVLDDGRVEMLAG